MKLYGDIETRSAANLKKTGGYVYAEHPTTEITHFAYGLEDGPVRVWLPPRSTRPYDTPFYVSTTTLSGHPVEITGCRDMPAGLHEAMEHAGITLVAHNAGFERIQLGGAAGARIGVPTAAIAPLSRWNCTAARASNYGLPRSLDGVCNALSLPIQKDKEGHALMLRMCKPKPRTGVGDRPIEWLDDDDSMVREAIYCADDVYAERLVDQTLPELSATEREVWEATERMNDRGIAVDTQLLIAMYMLIEAAELQVNAEINEATKVHPDDKVGRVPKVTNHGALTKWLKDQDIDDDFANDGVGKVALAMMLERTDLPDLVRSVLLMRRNGGKSSASKYRAILQRLSADGRLHGCHVFCGAAMTGRWSATGAQTQNLPRGGSVKDIEGAIAAVLGGATLDEIAKRFGPPLVVASELLRPVFIAGD